MREAVASEAALKQPGEVSDTPNIRGLVGWRSCDKSFMIWFKKPDGSRVQTQKGLQVKTTKKVGGKEVPLNRMEFLREKKKTYRVAIQKWNEHDCSTRQRLEVPCNKK